MIYLFDRFDTVSDEQLEEMIAALPPKRKEKALRYRYRNGQLTCAVAYLLFLYAYRRDLGKTGTPDFAIAENEKPYLEGEPNIHFNLSHCNSACVGMIGRKPVGIDVQETRSMKQAYLERICSEREQERIRQAPNPELEFTRIWTEKEAISKYTGDGVFRDVRSVSVEQAPLELMVATTQLRPGIYMTACGEIEDADFSIHSLSVDELMLLCKE